MEIVEEQWKHRTGGVKDKISFSHHNISPKTLQILAAQTIKGDTNSFKCRVAQYLTTSVLLKEPLVTSFTGMALSHFSTQSIQATLSGQIEENKRKIEEVEK